MRCFLHGCCGWLRWHHRWAKFAAMLHVLYHLKQIKEISILSLRWPQIKVAIKTLPGYTAPLKNQQAEHGKEIAATLTQECQQAAF